MTVAFALLTILFLALLLVAGFFVYYTLTEFSPAIKAKPLLQGTGMPKDATLQKQDFTIASWNIGYAGLGQDMDFFYDGGKRVRPNIEEYNRYSHGVRKVIASFSPIDFILLQEIDIHSKRSWFHNQFAEYSEELPGHVHSFVPNYKTRFVPFPLHDPMGEVLSGLGNFLSLQPDDAWVRYYNKSFYWPKRLFFLKRCFVLFKFRVNNGKDLVIINTHNSAFDSQGKLRKHESEILSDVMKNEYSTGNYVICGGDWNSNPRNFIFKAFPTGDKAFSVQPPFSGDFLPDWQFVFDPDKPTNRNVDLPYRSGQTTTTILDFFVVSPNVQVIHKETLNLGFQFSDHNPIIMKFQLR